MNKFTTNWAMHDRLISKTKTINILESEELTDEIRHKLKLIEKAFK